MNFLSTCFVHSAYQGTVSKQVLPFLGAQWRLGVATDQSQHSLRQQNMPATICAVHKLHHHVSSIVFLELLETGM